MKSEFHPAAVGCAGLLVSLTLAAGALAGEASAPTAPSAPSAPTAPTTPAAPAAPSANAAPAAPAPTPTPAPISADQASYEFGLNFGDQLRHAGLDQSISIGALERGVKDGLTGKKITAAEQQQLAQYVRSMRDQQGIRNKAAASEFLAANAKQPGIKTTPSGLQYRVIAPGDANRAPPKPEDLVTVQYRGKLLDGTEFDSSYAHGHPATFQAGHVIKGWQEALAMMNPGAKWELFVPPELAYGMNSPPAIPPGSLLEFEVELLSVQQLPARPVTTKPIVPAPGAGPAGAAAPNTAK